ncbi:GNAT family N-acetyltransferase [Planomicrobium sp. YIM 101495]|uniref:GNAT family N-acetyltransferase n=1 Tax=Planomicrobium sp. YIM 101495 TaxID=2665160 RepID=UPI0012B6F784|nr:GNAT family N-acetyltransferase [Planomicrobium sp. YIM 101495]MTD30567.1 GNAT family N-acetyltransferase [Planomicrobium sp. YIM 101495]
MTDVFFSPHYGKLYEEIENGTCEQFEFRHPFGKIRHVFIKRPLPFRTNGQIFYEILTPYGYGGPVIEKVVQGREKDLVRLYDAAFSDYCEKHAIIREFIRFHPLVGNADHFKDVYNIQFRRMTIGTDLTKSADPFQTEFSKSARRNVRNALKQGVTFRVIVNPSSLGAFPSIYYQTMKRNQASSLYYFDDRYFAECLTSLGKAIVFVEVLYEGKVIGAGINFSSNEWIHTHLSGTLAEFHHLSPAYILQYALVLWGKENNKELIHDGGGRTADEDDLLYLFKKQFSKNTDFRYEIGYKVRNAEVNAKALQQDETEDALFRMFSATS